MADCPGADGLVCLNGWLYSSVGGMIFPANKTCPTCNVIMVIDEEPKEEKRVADNRCAHEGCDKFALLGKEHCYEHVPGKEVEVEEEEIPQRFLDRDPNPENWERYVDVRGKPKIVESTSYLECPFCAGAVHEDSAKWHVRYHLSLNENIRAVYRVIQNRG